MFCLLASLFDSLVQYPCSTATGTTSAAVHSTASVLTKSILTNLDEKQCGFSQCFLKDSSLGRPVVFISLGRSGSTVFSSVMSSMFAQFKTKGFAHQLKEDVGHSLPTIQSKFEKIDVEHPEQPGKCWLVEILCKKQAENQVVD